MQKAVLELEDMHDDYRLKAVKKVASLSGIKTIDTNMEDKTMTLVGNVDPAKLMTKLRKSGWCTKLVTYGPVEEKKKAQPKDDEEHRAAGVTWQANNPTPAAYFLAPPEENPSPCAL